MTTIHKLLPRDIDCLVLGGGITGAGIARDAAMRGLRCLLVDSHDFASGTSHLTSKLIHGGLRYLEHAHIKPVIEGIVERDRLLHTLAPNLVSPMRFIMPFEGRSFPKWLATVCSLQLYGLSDLVRDRRWSGGLLAPGLRRDYPEIKPHPFCISFWDAQANDARLVMSSLRAAEQEGAFLCNYTRIKAASFDGNRWSLQLVREEDGFEWTLQARSIVNATGPWSPLTAEALGVEPKELMWIKGSHILINRPARFGDDAIVIRSVRDRRPLWAVPWENRLIIGSTESRYSGVLREARPTRQEVDDLYESFVHYFPRLGVQRADIRCAFSGVRPIIAQSTASENSLSREHRISVDQHRHLITVNGGKLTTFRLMAQQTIDKIQVLIGRSKVDRDTKTRLQREMLWPGIPKCEIDSLIERHASAYPDVHRTPGLVRHLTRLYGRDAASIMDEMVRDPDLGKVLGDGPPITLAECGYLCRHEYVCHLVDLVKRRTSFYFLADDPGFTALAEIADHVAPILGWDTKRKIAEIAAVTFEFGADMAAIRDVPKPSPGKKSLPACA
ncbi:MAG: glycerol-3-phosphate dehydrogenase/oxidase [Phycisphaerae bacterium]